jgi:alkylated DNA repair dioxygenase AlkB
MDEERKLLAELMKDMEKMKEVLTRVPRLIAGTKEEKGNGGGIFYLPRALSDLRYEPIEEAVRGFFPSVRAIAVPGPNAREAHDVAAFALPTVAEKRKEYGYGSRGEQKKALHPFPYILLQVKDRVEAEIGDSFSGLGKIDFDCALVNRYFTADDSIGAHSEEELLGDRRLAIVILYKNPSDCRAFQLWHLKSGQRLNFLTYHGDVIFMLGASVQKKWKHGVPKEKSDTGERLSLSFRKIDLE